MIMKKEYMKPDMQVVELRRHINLLAGSDPYVKIQEEEYDENEMTDL